MLYREAAKLEPKEDYYYLFLGRALLQLADMTQPGNAMLPADLGNVPTQDLLALCDRGARSGTREDLCGRRTRPWWPHSGSTRSTPITAPTWPGCPRVGLHRCAQSRRQPHRQPAARGPGDAGQQGGYSAPGTGVDYYREATALSPQNAGLWNELATVQYIRNDLTGALASINRSWARSTLSTRLTCCWAMCALPPAMCRPRWPPIGRPASWRPTT